MLVSKYPYDKRRLNNLCDCLAQTVQYHIFSSIEWPSKSRDSIRENAIFKNFYLILTKISYFRKRERKKMSSKEE